MLNQIRKFSDSIIIKILFGMLILSFVFWGIGDVIRGANKDYVAVVDGDQYISTSEFLQAKKRQINNIKQVYPQISEQELNSLNLNQNIINSLVLKKLLEIEAKHLGILISDDLIVNKIRQEAAFKDKDGNFDPLIFKNILAHNNMIESEFAQEMKGDIANNIMMQTFATPIQIPSFLESMIDKYNKQKRKILVVTAQATKLYTPKQSEIEEYYNKNITKFSSPEQRDIEYIYIQPSHFKDQITITEVEIKEELAKIASTSQKNVVSKNQVKEHIRLQKIEQKMYTALQEIEDEIASTNSFKAIADKFKIGYNKLDKVVPNDKRAPNFKDFADKVAGAEELTPTEMYNIDEHKPGYYVINIKKIHPAKPLGLTEDIKKKITNYLAGLFKFNENQKIIAEASSITDLKKLAQLKNIKEALLIITRPNSYKKDNSAIPYKILLDIFNLEKPGDKTSIYTNKNNEYSFAILTEIINSSTNPTSAELKDINNMLIGTFSSIQQQEFIKYLQEKYSVKIRSDMLENL
jgi:peptidyl-prolyl cis-trans isomerase D